jgi:hypothetical protein
MWTVPSIVAVIGGIALLAGLFGGLQAQQITVPSLPRELRVLSGLTGLVLVSVAVWLSLPPVAPQPGTTPQPTTQANIPTVQSGLVPTAPTIESPPASAKPMITPQPTAVSVSTAAPTITLPHAPTQTSTSPTTITSTPNCPYAGSTDTQNFINLIRAEEQAVLKEDLGIITVIYAKGATITDVELGQTWSNVVEHYQLLFENLDFIELTHYDFEVVKHAGNKAWVKSSDSSVMILAGSNEKKKFVSNPGDAHFVFEKDDAGCWRIVHFSKLASHEPFP